MGRRKSVFGNMVKKLRNKLTARFQDDSLEQLVKCAQCRGIHVPPQILAALGN